MTGGRFGGSAFWTDERVELLKRLWADGDSASSIAKTLNCGFTKNAVLGKVHRLALPMRRPSTVGAASTRRARSWTKPKTTTDPRYSHTPRPPTRVVDRPAPDDSTRVTLLARQPHQCCWPLGGVKGPDTIMCGAPRDGDHSYCGFHVAVATGKGGSERPDVSFRLRKMAHSNITTLAILETREVPFDG